MWALRSSSHQVFAQLGRQGGRKGLLLPLADDGVNAQVVMNSRSGDTSPLLAQMQALVREVVRERYG